MSEEHGDGMWEPPVGDDDFKSVRDNRGYFVDKSGPIAKILRYKGTGSFLITRPRRFGKSLNLSMVDAFFNIEHQGNSWFDGLAIAEDAECMAEMSRYPVIRLNFKDLDVESYDSFIHGAMEELSFACRKHKYLLDSDVDDVLKKRYSRLLKMEATESELVTSLKILCEMLREHHGVKAVVLIDEYDAPINKSYRKPSQERIASFIKRFLSSALKSNESLRFGIITGVMRIAKESLFSGLNNLRTDDIFGGPFEECFGFTEKEVKAMLKFYGHPEKFEECKEWYDGYRFGDSEMYNPWSVLCYVDRGFVPRPYWAGTGGDSVMKTMVEDADESTMDGLMALGSGKEVQASMNDRIVYAEIEKGGDAAYTVLAMAGYLAPSGDGDLVRVPNKEVYGVYLDLIAGGPDTAARFIRDMFSALRKGNSNTVADCLSGLMRSSLSARILDIEHAYQTFLTGLLMGFCGDYEIYADRLESGEGYADIALRRKRGPGPNVVMELKRSTTEKDLEKDSVKALEQINSRRYAEGMEGRTLTYGISLFRKKALVTPGE